MAKQAAIEQDGVIVEALSNAMFGKWTRNHGPYFRKNENALHQNPARR